jgi:mannose-6-phosphate isomerase-like protein (cupin superfamily)
MRPSLRLARSVFALTALASATVGTACAQFGGRPGDVVVYTLTSKGDQSFEQVASSYQNPAATLTRFEHFPASSKVGAPPIGFPMLNILFLHKDQDDVFQMIVQDDVVPVPHHLYLTTFKIFVTQGSRRDFGYSTEQPRDFTTAEYTTFLEGADLGPNQSMGGKLYVLGWTHNDLTPPLIMSTPDVPGPAVPPGKTGTQLVVDSAVIPGLQPWTPLRITYPAATWQDGVDLKFLENDPVAGNTTSMLRLKPGRRTQAFRIHGDTHFYVLEGNITLTPVGGAPIVLKPNDYAFLPDGLAYTLSNTRAGLPGGQ